MAWFWNTLVAPWPDLGSKEFEYVRDLASLATGFLSLLLAALAIKMGLDNDKVTKKQVQILEKLQELEGKQADFAETQQRLLSRAAKLSVQLRVIRRDGDVLELGFAVKNDGDSGASGFYWHLMLPRTAVDASSASFLLQSRTSEEGGIVKYSGYTDQPVYPERTKVLMETKVNLPKAGPFEVRWQLSAEDGLFPGKNQFGAFVVGPEGSIEVRTYAVGGLELSL